MSKTVEGTEKIKKYMNRKIVLGVSSLLMCIGVIAICSFVPFAIDPTRWQTKEFLTDELIIVAIVIFSMVATMFVGQASNAQNEKSNLAKARVKFFTSVEKILNINAFNQWVRKKMQPTDIENMKKRIMRQAGIEDFSVLDLEHKEIKSLLETPQKYGNRFYKGLSEEQIKVLLDLKDGKKYKIQLVEPEYYLSVKNLIDSRTITERSSTEGLKKGAYLAKNIIARVILTVLTAMIFASLMKDLTAKMDVGQATMKFLSRLWALVSSSFMGYLTGCQINDIDAEYIAMRVQVHEMFLKDTDFVALDQQEEAKEEFKQRVSREERALIGQDAHLIEHKGDK